MRAVAANITVANRIGFIFLLMLIDKLRRQSARSKLLTFPSSQRRGGCAEGADGVVRVAKLFSRADYPGATRHPSSARLSLPRKYRRRGRGADEVLGRRIGMPA